MYNIYMFFKLDLTYRTGQVQVNHGLLHVSTTLEAVKVGDDIAVQGLPKVAEDVATPAVGVGAGKVSPHNLLQERRQVSGLLRVVFMDLLNGAGPGKGPLVGADHEKEGQETVLADRVYEEQVLPAPVGSRE